MELYKNDTIFCHYVKVSDIEYKINSVICLNMYDDFPQFGTIQNIILHKKILWLSVKKHSTDCYSSVMGAYMTNDVEDYVTLKLSDLKFKTTFCIWTRFANSQKYVLTRSINFN